MRGKEQIWEFPKIRGTQYRPKNNIVLNIGIPKRVPIILGNPYMDPGIKGSYTGH